MVVIKRDGREVEFDKNKIINAINKFFFLKCSSNLNNIFLKKSEYTSLF